jgi:hypothetical protein
MVGKEQVAENEACEALAEEFARLHREGASDYERGMTAAAEAIAARIRARLD